MRLVSTALQLEDQMEALADALRIIDDVHLDGNLPSLPVRWTSYPGVRGYYRSSYNNAVEIGIGPISIVEKAQVILIHEVGHFLDHKGITPAGFASLANAEVMAGWRLAVEESDAIRALRAMMDRLPDSDPDQAFLDYLLTPDEIWARAYTQYIATRSGHAGLIDQIAVERTRLVFPQRQWSDLDFEPVAQAIDGLFGELGWIQQRKT